MFKFASGFSVPTAGMERQPNSVVGTPADNVVVQRRSKSKSYRLSYRSCLSAASRLGFTPTMTSRRMNSSRRAPKYHNITERVDPEQLALLVKTEWQLSYVTPLYQFRHTQLKSYSRQLSAFIAAQKLQGMAVEVDGSQDHYRVSFSMVSGMVEAGDDAETVLIQILSKTTFARRDEPQRRVWSGWLTCVNGNPEYLRSLPKDFVSLPLFGSHGPENLTSVVKAWFQRTFDCCVGPLEISQTSLQWLLALWTNCHPESSIQHLTMVWSIPVAPPLQVTYAVEPQDAWALWSSVRKGRSEEEEKGEEEESSIDIEEVKRFIQSLKSHFYRHFRLDVSAGCLSQVSTGLGSAKSSGRIKISNSRYMITTLMLLTECALLKMPI